MTFDVTITNTNETFRCGDNDSVLKAMEQLCRRGIPVGCRNGGCGICKVRVLEGSCATAKMSRAVVSLQEEQQGCALACRLYPRSDLKVEVVGRMARAVTARTRTAFSFEFRTTWQVQQPDQQSDKET